MDSYTRFAGLVGDPSAGVTMRKARNLSRGVQPRPWWADAVPSVRQATADELPEGFGFGWVFEAPVIDTRRYLPWLMQQVRDAGIEIKQRTVTRAGAAAGRGRRGRELHRPRRTRAVPGRGPVPDPRAESCTSRPRVSRTCSSTRSTAGGLAYIVPRGDDCVLGGTATEGDDGLEPRPADADGILQRCAGMVPELAEAKRLADVVGLRPGRADVRLETQTVAGKRVVHNYGHGGSGFTLSWGCAAEVVDRVRR